MRLFLFAQGLIGTLLSLVLVAWPAAADPLVTAPHTPAGNVANVTIQTASVGALQTDFPKPLCNAQHQVIGLQASFKAKGSGEVYYDLSVGSTPVAHGYWMRTGSTSATVTTEQIQFSTVTQAALASSGASSMHLWIQGTLPAHQPFDERDIAVTTSTQCAMESIPATAEGAASPPRHQLNTVLYIAFGGIAAACIVTLVTLWRRWRR